MKKVSLRVMALLALTILFIVLKFIKQHNQILKDDPEGYYFAYVVDQQHQDGCCCIIISNLVYINTPNLSKVSAESIMSSSFASYCEANFYKRNHYLTNTFIAGPYNSATAAKTEKDKVVIKYKTRHFAVQFVSDFNYSR